MADPMKIRANVVGDSTEVKVLMNHEMETGQRKDSAGKVDPGLVHPDRDRDAQRQDRAVGAMGAGHREEPVPVVQVQGRGEGRQGPDHLGRQQGRQAHRRSRHRLNAAGAPRRGRAHRSRGSRRARAKTRRRVHRRRLHANHRTSRPVVAPHCVAGARAPVALGQGSAVDEIAKYRAALQDGNPAELWEARGEGLWKQPARPEEGLARDNAIWGSGRASSRAPTRSCRATSPTPTA